MKKLLGIVLSAAMLLSMAACGSTAASSAASSAAADSTADAATATDAAASDLKVGVITIGDETEGYTAAHINGIKPLPEAGHERWPDRLEVQNPEGAGGL